MARAPTRRVGPFFGPCLLLALLALLLLAPLLPGVTGGGGGPTTSGLRDGPSSSASKAPMLVPHSLTLRDLRPSMLPPTPPITGWVTPLGSPSLNASTPGYAPEVVPLAGAPESMNVSLGAAAANASGLVVSPQGTVVVALGNETLCALNGSTLAVDWWGNTSRSLVGGPVLAGGLVYAADRQGEIFAFNLSQTSSHARPFWNYSTGEPSEGATPLPYGGDLFLLTGHLLTVLNASTGTLLNRNLLPALDTAHSLAYGGGYLYGQELGAGASLLELSVLGSNVSALADGITAPGVAMYSDGASAVAGPNGSLSWGIQTPGYWHYNISLGAGPEFPVEPMAGSNGELFATDGHGPLYEFSELSGTHGSGERSASWVSSPPAVAGAQVFAGANDSVEAFNISTPFSDASPAWIVRTPGPITRPLAISDGILYALDGTGNLTAIGSPALHLRLSVDRPRAAQGSPVTFTAVVTGGVGAPDAFDWLFSDGGTMSGTGTAQHTFNVQGPAWAEAVATDAQGLSTPIAQASLTILPPWVVHLYPRASISGPAPLDLNLTAVPSGGNGTLTLSGAGFQVQGAQPEWIASAGYTASLVLNRSGTDLITAWVNDTAGDTNVSSPLWVNVTAATPPAPVVQLVPLAPGAVEVLWTSPPVAGFADYYVNASEDSSPLSSKVLALPNTTSEELTGLRMGASLTVAVTMTTLYGHAAMAPPTHLTVPSFAPSLGVSAATGLPGQALLVWSMPAGLDQFSHWVVQETFQGSTPPVNLTLPSYVGAANDSYVTAPLADLNTTTFALEAVASNGNSVTSLPVSFTPAWSAPALELRSNGLTINATWTLTTVPDFSHVTICFEPVGGAAAPSCPVSSSQPVSPVEGVSFPVPSAGTYTVNLTAYAENGFVIPGPGETITVSSPPAAPPFYDALAYGAPVWSWALGLLLLFLVALLGYLLYRERRDIPPYLGEVLPWDPLSPELSPHAKPRSPETLEAEPKLHRHPASHSHRHLRSHKVPPAEAGEEEGAAEEAAPGASSARRAPAARKASPKADAEEEGEPEGIPRVGDEEEASRAAGRPGPKAGRPGPSPAGPGKERKAAAPATDEEEDGGAAEASGEDDDEAAARLKKMPVVLRHRDEEPSDSDDAPALRAPAPKTSKPGSGASGKAASGPKSGKDTDDEDESEEDEAAAPPKKPAPRPRTDEDTEPTL